MTRRSCLRIVALLAALTERMLRVAGLSWRGWWEVTWPPRPFYLQTAL